MQKIFKYLLALSWFALSLISCGTKGEKHLPQPQVADKEREMCGNKKQSESIKDLTPAEMMPLVEGAVDTWFFYHLDNYGSYTPIIRRTDYDSLKNIHIHHIRYRVMNREGGYETSEKAFEVNFIFDEKGTPNFNVIEIPESGTFKSKYFERP